MSTKRFDTVGRQCYLKREKDVGFAEIFLDMLKAKQLLAAKIITILFITPPWLKISFAKNGLLHFLLRVTVRFLNISHYWFPGKCCFINCPCFDSHVFCVHCASSAALLKHYEHVWTNSDMKLNHFIRANIPVNLLVIKTKATLH